MINEQGIKKYLHAPISVVVKSVSESTNSDAHAMALSEDFSEALIIARRQTAGRGRMGRSFYSEAGGLYMSILLRPSCNIKDVANITTAAAVAVSRAIEAVAGIECQIKWVNDIYYAGKKVCGILTETEISEGNIRYIIVGIGLNLILPEGGFPEEISTKAGALFEVLPEEMDNRLAASITDEFFKIYYGGVKTSDYIYEYRRRSFIVGREIEVSKFIGESSRRAIAEEICDDLSLLVRYSDGSHERLISGEVIIKI